MIHIGIISAYPGEDWHAQRIAGAAQRFGTAELLRPTDFGAVIAEASRLTVRGEDARAFDLFLTPRAIGDEGDAELQLELYRALAETGVAVVNDVRALTRAVDKFRSSWEFARAGVRTPKVVLAQRLEEACRAVAEMRDVVVKPVFGSLGIGVERLGVEDAGRLAGLLERHRVLYLQAYVEPELDVRAFVVGDQVAAAIARRPKPGEFRANIHQGSSARPITLDPAVSALAVRASRALGLDYSGVDLLVTADGPVVIEVNGTPAFRGVNEATGDDMAVALVAHAVAVAEQRREEAARGRPHRRGAGAPRRRAGRQARPRDDVRPVRA